MLLKTIDPSKQRLSRYEADIRLRNKHMHVHLPKESRQKLGKRSVAVRVGDTVKILRGDYKGKSGLVTQLDTKREKVFIQGLMRKKMDGKEAFLAFPPSNLILMNMETKDKKRVKKKIGAQDKTKARTANPKE